MYKSMKDHWEIIKMSIRGSTMQYASRKKKAENNLTTVLEKKLKFWQDQLDVDEELRPKIQQRILELRNDLEKLTAIKTQGAMLRCRQRWADMAEKPTKYFLNLEKANYNKKTIHRLYSVKEKKIVEKRGNKRSINRIL